MNIKEPLTQDQMTQQNLQKRRFFIKGIGGAITPVVLTIASPPILGQAMCLSQQMSGNLSAHVTSCVLGLSPGFWKQDQHIAAWMSAGFDYGSLPYPAPTNPQWDDYSGGTLCNAVVAFGTGSNVCQNPTVPLGGEPYPMREWLNSHSIGTPPTNPSGGDLWHLIAALLNSKYVANYVLTTDQVKGLYSGDIPIPPPYTTISDYLDTTWTK